ncbi:MAG: hypothetical protein U0517_04390 [Candidatus Andersenbacteria bacterium]
MSWLRTLRSDHIVASGLSLALVILLAQIVWLVWVDPPSKDPQALHYTVYFGIDLFGPGRVLWVHAAASAVVLVLNAVLASVALERQALAARLATWSAAVFAAIVFAATILIGVFVSRS